MPPRQYVFTNGTYLTTVPCSNVHIPKASVRLRGIQRHLRAAALARTHTHTPLSLSRTHSLAHTRARTHASQLYKNMHGSVKDICIWCNIAAAAAARSHLPRTVGPNEKWPKIEKRVPEKWPK